MNFFKAFGYITTGSSLVYLVPVEVAETLAAQAVYFSNDLKLAHYVKIPPRCTFAGQMIATFVSTLVCTG